MMLDLTEYDELCRGWLVARLHVQAAVHAGMLRLHGINEQVASPAPRRVHAVPSRLQARQHAASLGHDHQALVAGQRVKEPHDAVR